MNRAHLEDLCRMLLRELGEDPNRAGLVDTPRRWAEHWAEFIEYHDAHEVTTFESVRVDQLVVVRGITVWSLCEHHLLPYRCELAMGYLPREKVLGLSKFARIAQTHAHRLTLQEALVNEIAENLKDVVATEDVAVLGRGYHLCMAMRGIRTEAEMATSVMGGRFRENAALRMEVLAMMEKKQ